MNQQMLLFFFHLCLQKRFWGIPISSHIFVLKRIATKQVISNVYPYHPTSILKNNISSSRWILKCTLIIPVPIEEMISYQKSSCWGNPSHLYRNHVEINARSQDQGGPEVEQLGTHEGLLWNHLWVSMLRIPHIAYTLFGFDKCTGLGKTADDPPTRPDLDQAWPRLDFVFAISCLHGCFKTFSALR